MSLLSLPLWLQQWYYYMQNSIFYFYLADCKSAGYCLTSKSSVLFSVSLELNVWHCFQLLCDSIRGFDVMQALNLPVCVIQYKKCSQKNHFLTLWNFRMLLLFQFKLVIGFNLQYSITFLSFICSLERFCVFPCLRSHSW